MNEKSMGIRLICFFSLIGGGLATADTVKKLIECFDKLESISSGAGYSLNGGKSGFLLTTENGFDVFTVNEFGVGRSQSYALPVNANSVGPSGENKAGYRYYFLKLALPGVPTHYKYLTYSWQEAEPPTTPRGHHDVRARKNSKNGKHSGPDR